jgi:hypothetical protein
MLDLLVRSLGAALHTSDGCDWWMPAPHLHICLDSAPPGALPDVPAHVLIYDRHPRDGRYITDVLAASSSEAAAVIHTHVFQPDLNRPDLHITRMHKTT